MFYLAPLLAASPQDVRKRKSAAGPFDALSSAPGQVRSPSSVARVDAPNQVSQSEDLGFLRVHAATARPSEASHKTRDVERLQEMGATGDRRRERRARAAAADTDASSSSIR